MPPKPTNPPATPTPPAATPTPPPTPTPALKFLDQPRLRDGTMLLAFSGWMDGGLVSTGTVRRLLQDGGANKVATIDPDPFYIYSFPGDMETTALFRPHVKYEGGLIGELDLPANEFFCDSQRNILFFVGKEPNLAWQAFGDCVFAVARRVGIKRIIFIGSFGGSVPHTREPRLFASVSDAALKDVLKPFGVRFNDYEGPASFSSYLTARASGHDLEMISLAAEIPGYLKGANPLSIEAVTRRLARLLNLPVDLHALRSLSDEWESRVTAAVAKDEELAATVRKLEDRYDNELIGAPDAAEEEDESGEDESGEGEVEEEEEE